MSKWNENIINVEVHPSNNSAKFTSSLLSGLLKRDWKVKINWEADGHKMIIIPQVQVSWKVIMFHYYLSIEKRNKYSVSFHIYFIAQCMREFLNCVQCSIYSLFLMACFVYCEWVSDCCLTPTQQFFSYRYIMARAS